MQNSPRANLEFQLEDKVPHLVAGAIRWREERSSALVVGSVPKASSPWRAAVASLSKGYLEGLREYIGDHFARDVKFREVFAPYRQLPVLEDQQHQILLDNERLKTQLIAERRALLAARQSETQLQEEKGKLLDTVCELVKLNKSLQESMIGAHQSRICFHEAHRGVVSDSIGDQIEVVFDTKNGEVRQIYDRSQFVCQRMPTEGQKVEAHVFLAIAKEEAEGPHLGAVSDLPEFGPQGITGDIRL